MVIRLLAQFMRWAEVTLFWDIFKWESLWGTFGFALDVVGIFIMGFALNEPNVDPGRYYVQWQTWLVGLYICRCAGAIHWTNMASRDWSQLAALQTGVVPHVRSTAVTKIVLLLLTAGAGTAILTAQGSFNLSPTSANVTNGCDCITVDPNQTRISIDEDTATAREGWDPAYIWPEFWETSESAIVLLVLSTAVILTLSQVVFFWCARWSQSPARDTAERLVVGASLVFGVLFFAVLRMPTQVGDLTDNRLKLLPKIILLCVCAVAIACGSAAAFGLSAPPSSLVPLDFPHLKDRVGTFVMLVVGETVMALATTSQSCESITDGSLSVASGAMLCMLFLVALLYFDSGRDDHILLNESPDVARIFRWFVLHLLLFTCLLAVGVCVLGVVNQAMDGSSSEDAHADMLVYSRLLRLCLAASNVLIMAIRMQQRAKAVAFDRRTLAYALRFVIGLLPVFPWEGIFPRDEKLDMSVLQIKPGVTLAFLLLSIEAALVAVDAFSTKGGRGRVNPHEDSEAEMLPPSRAMTAPAPRTSGVQVLM